jgi:predicted dinucleotide-binding enzyme
LDVFLAGDDVDVKKRLTAALSACGLRVIDVGPLRRARQLEGMGTLQATMGTNWGSTKMILP